MKKMGIFQIAQNNDRKLVTSRLKIGNEISSDSLKIKDEFLTYYKSIFQDNEQFSRSTEFPSLNNIAKQLNHDQKQYLIQPITAEELLNALSSAAKKKSPGIDGLSYEFYLKNYEFFKEDLIKLCNSYLVDGKKPPSSFKDGVVIFIPKCPNPSVNEFRPISLLNTDYKLFAKILANRVQNILPDLIGTYQAACHKEEAVLR